MWLKWLPWRYVVSQVAQARGFIDPVALLNSVHRFAQPSEVAQPTELLRAGVVMHARGLINTQAIQHNLDWIWPYWVVRQFDPDDPSFIPRAFSITHVNLSHRNWTAVGLPGLPELPLVDPRGLVTPHFDGWSLDFWLLSATAGTLLPSRAAEAEQKLDVTNGVKIVTTIQGESGLSITSATYVAGNDDPVCRVEIAGHAVTEARLVVAVRPYNPEGISFVHDIRTAENSRRWSVNGKDLLLFSDAPDITLLSNYREGDVFGQVAQAMKQQPHLRSEIECDVGMATGAAVFTVPASGDRFVSLELPLRIKSVTIPIVNRAELSGNCCQLRLGDNLYQELFDSALRTLLLLSPGGEIYPGPFTYKRFWFRDAAFMLNSLLCSGLTDVVERVVDTFPLRQDRNGYYLSQEGEWDSNGEALWILSRYCKLAGKPPKAEWIESIVRGANWIVDKRESRPFFCKKHCESDRGQATKGLLPAGFSAEHFGPSDYYYWDNFWGIAGLRAAADLLNMYGQKDRHRLFLAEADKFEAALLASIDYVSPLERGAAVPSAPTRRLDAAAIGNIVASYPLQLPFGTDSRFNATVDYLFENHLYQEAFFQDMTHSGINAYLTLHLAQAMLSRGDLRFARLVRRVAELATSTGQWPEAIHPRTGGGCMGDGQHGWAAAEWVMIIRNFFVREESSKLILGSGLTSDLLADGKAISFGPTLTEFGLISVELLRTGSTVAVSWRGSWHKGCEGSAAGAPIIEVALPGATPQVAEKGSTNVTVNITR